LIVSSYHRTIRCLMCFAAAMFLLYLFSGTPKLSISTEVESGQSSNLNTTAPFLVGDRLAGEVTGTAFVSRNFIGSRFIFRNDMSHVELLQKSDGLVVEFLSSGGKMYVLGPLAMSPNQDENFFSLFLNENGTDITFSVGSLKTTLNVPDEKIQWNLQNLGWNPNSPDESINISWSKEREKFYPFLLLGILTSGLIVFMSLRHLRQKRLMEF
jgi:hypothetical protein